jgi:hypothetical protein
MTLMTDLHLFFFEMSKKCWARFRVRNSTYLPSSTKLLKLIHFLLLHIIYFLVYFNFLDCIFMGTITRNTKIKTPP